MNKIPITICLFTSTQGHFGVKSRYIQTLDSLYCALPLSEYEAKVANIKVSPGEDDVASGMASVLKESYGFEVKQSMGEWSHGKQSHQTEYMKDQEAMFASVSTPYVLALEDDWAICVNPLYGFTEILSSAIDLLEKQPDIMQVRFPRYQNEHDRINDLYAKHGLFRRAFQLNNEFYVGNDYSANPSIYRTRDIRAASILVRKIGVPQHVEHGTGEVLKAMSHADLPLAFFNPEIVHISHLGTPLGQEDSLDKPILSA